MDSFEAICIKNACRKNGKEKGKITFIEGNTYNFSDKSFVIDFYGIGKYSVKNELGTETVVDEFYFDEHFKRI